MPSETELPVWNTRRFAITQHHVEGMYLRRLDAEDPAGTLLYIHGLGESGLSFEPLMTHPQLAGWNHLAPDLPGYGKSFWKPRPLGLEEQAAALAGLLETQGQQPVVVLGHSMGGVIGILLAELSPRRVRALVNVEGNISLGDCGFSGRVARHSLDAWLDHGASAVLESILNDPDEAPQVTRAYAASIQFCDPRAYHRNSDDLVAASSSRTLAPRMAALTCPTTYVHGVPRGTGERSLGLLAAAGIQTIGIEGAGHWAFLDQPQAFATALGTFLADLPVKTTP